MQRLNFQLPDFTRLMWTSDEARAVWEPRLRRIVDAWLDIEWLAVAAGVRKCGLTSVSPGEFVAKGGGWARHGLSALPVAIQGAANYAYASTTPKAEPGQPFVFRVVVGTPEDVAAFQAAYDASDDATMGQLLNYPPCCRAFFQDVWVRQQMIDTTWPMAAASPGEPGHGDACLELNGPPEANILWRWVGVRAAPHLPCSFQCAETVARARQFMAVGRDAGLGLEMDWLLDILSWPVEWSALHGIAEVKTPVLKVSTRTDATPTRYTVRFAGSAYPAEGAVGVAFPFRQPKRRHVTASRSFQRGLKNPLEPEAALPDWYALDNGFSSRFIMDHAHRPLVELAVSALGSSGGTVLDLGCGNAALLKKLHEANPAITPFGIDVDAQRLDHARELLPEFAANFWHGDLFDDEPAWQAGVGFDLVLLMPGRLLETDPDRAARLRQRIRERSRHVLVYAYGEWLTRCGDLCGLARAAGLDLTDNAAFRTATASLAIVAPAPNIAHAGG
ncbi:MAG: class I SAM-dependent methyltransferase [Anaerolineae bacterium]|nr:class I SAM-dependent methyltransferase [Anaerolineae bacterium]